MNRSIHFLLLSCKKATALSDKKLETDLSWADNFRLKLHLSICDGCKMYMKQSLLLEKALRNHFSDLKTDSFILIENNSLKEKITSKF